MPAPQYITDATIRAYTCDWKHFADWCGERGLTALPASPQTLTEYFKWHTAHPTPRGAQYARTTMRRRLAAIRRHHKSFGYPDPAGNLQPIQRIFATYKGKPSNRKESLPFESALAMRCTTAKDYRNKALLLIGIAGSMRRREIVSVDREHITMSERRISIRLTDRTVNIAGATTVQALATWLQMSGITAGPVFRGIDRHGNLKARLSGDAVAYIVKTAAAGIGLDRIQYAAESLRR